MPKIRTGIGVPPVGTPRIGAHVNQTPQKYLYGFDNKVFQKPVDFVPTLPCNFTRDTNNIVQHDMDFSQYTSGTVLYVNLDTGNDTSGNGSSGTPYKTVVKAVTFASTGADSAYCIKVKSDSIFMRDEGWSNTAISITDKIISIIPDNTSGRIVMTSGQRSLTWSADGVATWKTTRSSVANVYDMRVSDSNGLKIPYTKVTSLVNCQALPNSWYTDATSTWVHTYNGLIPDSNIIVGLGAAHRYFLFGTAKLYMKNIDVITGQSAGCLYVGNANAGGSLNSVFVANGCNFHDSYVASNSLSVVSTGNTYLFNCKATHGYSDGFNSHYAQIAESDRRKCLVLKYDCESYEHGLASGTTHGSNNSTTCHEGASTIDIRGNYYNSDGPVCAHVNGCYSIAIDCNSKNNSFGGVVYSFDNNLSPTGITGKLLMYNCTHNGEALGSSDLWLGSSGQGMVATLYATNLPNILSGSALPTVIP